MAKRTLKDVDIRDKRVLVRVDFNIPIEQGLDAIASYDHRLRETLPTVRYLIDQGSKVVLCSHLGRPKGTVVEGLRMGPVGQRLSELLGTEVAVMDDCIGQKVRAFVNGIAPGQVVLLENLRFHVEEEGNDPGFAKELASLGDVFVMDAFAVSHRAHASTVGVTSYLPAVAGCLLEKEIKYLGQALDSPERPVGALLGGAKVSDKVALLDNLSDKVDCICIGGAMASTFIKAQGHDVGASLVEEDCLEFAASFVKQAGDKGVDVHIPEDLVVTDSLVEITGTSHAVLVGNVPHGWLAVDIGPSTAVAFGDRLSRCKTIIWNGPPGIFERPEFRSGTVVLANAIANSGAVTVVGGGSTAEAVEMLGLGDKMTHVSTGGGASLEYLEGKELPGIAVLPDK